MLISRGEVWLVRLDPIEGHEQGKIRPCVILSSDFINHVLNLSTIVPFTGTPVLLKSGKLSPLMVAVDPPDGGLKKVSYSMAHQARSVSHARFIQKLGNLSDEKLAAIVNSVQDTIGADE